MNRTDRQRRRSFRRPGVVAAIVAVGCATWIASTFFATPSVHVDERGGGVPAKSAAGSEADLRAGSGLHVRAEQPADAPSSKITSDDPTTANLAGNSLTRSVRLRVVDADGLAVGGAVVRLLARGPAGGRAVVVRVSTAGDDGWVNIPDVPINESLQLSIEVPASRLDVLSDLIPVWRAPDANPILSLRRAYSMRGTVHDLTGAPVPSLAVFCQGARERRRTVTSATGEFEFRKTPAGTFTLFAQGDRLSCEPVSVVVADGDPDPIRLVVTELLIRRVQIADWGRDLAATAMFARRVDGESESGDGLPCPIDHAGMIDVSALELGKSYFVWVPPIGERSTRCVYETNYLLADSPSTISTTPCGSIDGVLAGLDLPFDASKFGVRINAPGLNVAGKVAGDGSFRVSGLPFGSWVVTAEGWVGGHLFRGTSSATSGSTGVVVEMLRR